MDLRGGVERKNLSDEVVDVELEDPEDASSGDPEDLGGVDQLGRPGGEERLGRGAGDELETHEA